MDVISEVITLKGLLLPLKSPAMEPGWSYGVELELNIAEDN